MGRADSEAGSDRAGGGRSSRVGATGATSSTVGAWADRRVLAYAHQGGAWEAPSSTLYAVRRALSVGVTGIELDVHATADGELVVCHDATVDRTTPASGAISAMTWAELRELDNAYWFLPGQDAARGRPDADYALRGRAPGDPELGIARLEAILDVMEDHPTAALNLDIKATAPAVRPYEATLAALLRRRGFTDRVIVASFIDAATAAFRRAAPEIATSAGTQAVANLWQALHRGDPPAAVPYQAVQVPWRTGDLVVADGPLVHGAHQLGLAVHVWTINDDDAMGILLDAGVDGIITDCPSVLVRLIERRGLTYRPRPPAV